MNVTLETLLDYAISCKLMREEDRCYARNRLLALLKEDQYEIPNDRQDYTHIDELLEKLCAYAIEKGILLDSQAMKDAFDSACMDCVMMRPSQVIDAFYGCDSAQATKAFYAFSKDSNYIRTNRIAQNISWKHETAYGVLDITINCSKPEKDPKDIAMAKHASTSGYPTCVLCKENEGYYGTATRDGRSNIRLIPMTLDGETWYFQYSPYVYYNEHCIVLSGKHTPMKTSAATFRRLLEFVSNYPHYFLGANADLPIVGGSILSHDHYQGGNYTFAMAEANILESYDCFEKWNVRAQRLDWPLSVLRLSSKEPASLVMAATQVLKTWRTYDDIACDILAHTTEAHNTISTVARKRGERFELDLVLRNNRTTKEYPMGIFHPHEEIHHIKKENIGIIEVMGLAVLPARLKQELQWIEARLLQGDMTHDEALRPHQKWIDTLRQRKDLRPANIQEILRKEVGDIFLEGLAHCGVFKLDEAGKAGFKRFMETLNKEEIHYGD